MIMVKKTSLARDFTIFSAAVLLAVLIACVFIGAFVHHSYNAKQENKIAYKAASLDSALENYLDFINHYVNFVGNKISTKDNLSIDYINDLLKIGSYKDLDGSLEWTIFSWIDPNNKVATNPIDGIVEQKSPIARKYLQETPIHPWRFIFSEPTMGVLSNQLILPAGYGITNPKGAFLGTISFGLGIDKLTNELQRAMSSQEIVFILLDNKFNYILGSRDLVHSGVRTLINGVNVKKLEKQVSLLNNNNNILLPPIENDKFSFDHLYHSTKYPFYFLVGKNKKVANSEYWQIALPRITELCIMGIFFIILLYYLRRRMVRPLLLLASSAKKIALGNSNVNIMPNKYEEINLISEQLKDIQQAKMILANAKKDADLLNLTLEHKIQERTADLEKALAIRTEFLNSMSHEVRTPVQGITSISKGLVEHWGDHSEEKRFALASAVASNSQRLFSLVSNVLDLSTFNTGKMHFNMQRSNLITLAQEIIDECKMLYLNNKAIQIIFKHHPKAAFSTCDCGKISQVLRNLLTNSIKFMTEGEIEISIDKTQTLSLSNAFYTITVRDSGTSLPDSDLSKIFQPFMQSEATLGKASGAGLGLSICQKIINGHGGKIWAFNNKKHGISVAFTLPVNQEINLKKITKSSATSSLARGFIMMIDDESTCQMSMDLLLSGTGYTLISKYGGVAGLEYLKDHYSKIDLIFLDLMMPDMYGLTVLEVINSDPKLNHIPVVIQSGTNDGNEIDKTLRSGARAFIRKPYQRQQILDIIHEILTR